MNSVFDTVSTTMNRPMFERANGFYSIMPVGAAWGTDSQVRRCKPLVRQASPVFGKPE